MTDKELGKLWADTDYMETGYSGLVASLIRKLVEERKIILLTRHAKGAMWTDKEEAAAEKLALCDFGIDPTTWGENRITPASLQQITPRHTAHRTPTAPLACHTP